MRYGVQHILYENITIALFCFKSIAVDHIFIQNNAQISHQQMRKIYPQIVHIKKRNITNNNGLFDLAATAGLVTKSTYIHIEPK